MIDKKAKRQRRAIKCRAKIRELRVARLCITRSAKHLYAQIIVPAEKGDKVLVSASTLDKEVKARISAEVQANGEPSMLTSNNVKSAAIVGAVIAERALANSISQLAFDRSGFKYHGRVKALAESARKGGLIF